MQIFFIRSIALLYLLFVMLLAVMVLIEAHDTAGWSLESTKIYDKSILVGLAALSGWFSAALAFMSFLFGFAGGLFAKPVARENALSVAMRYALLFLTVALLLLSLLALWRVAAAYAGIEAKITVFHATEDGTQLGVSDVLKALGGLNLSIAAGVLAGLAVPGVPGFQAPEE